MLSGTGVIGNDMSNFIFIFSSRYSAWAKNWKARFPCYWYSINLLSDVLTMTFLLALSNVFNFDLLIESRKFIWVSKRSIIILSFISLPYISAFKRCMHKWCTQKMHAQCVMDKPGDIQYIPSLYSTSRRLRRFSKASADDSLFFSDCCIYDGPKS